MNVPQTEQALLSFGRTGPRSIHADGLRESIVDRAFEDLFAQHYPRLVKTLMRLTGDSGQAEELAADAFCRLYRQRPPGNPESLAGWLYRTGVNLGLDALRSNSRRVRREDEAGREGLRTGQPRNPLRDLLAEEQQVEQRGRVRSVLARLKPDQSQALLLNSSGFSGQEMSAVLGVKPDSLYVLLGRARAKFEQEYLKAYGRQQ